MPRVHSHIHRSLCNQNGGRRKRDTPLAQVGFLDESHRRQDGPDVIQAALHRDLSLRPLVNRNIAPDQGCSSIRQRYGPLQ